MLTELESLWDGHFGRIIITKDRIDLIGDKIRPVHFVLYLERPFVRPCFAAELNGLIAKVAIELVTTVWASPLVFSLRGDCSICFCVDSRKLDTSLHAICTPHLAWTNLSKNCESRQYSSRWTPAQSTQRSKLKHKIPTRRCVPHTIAYSALLKYHLKWITPRDFLQSSGYHLFFAFARKRFALIYLNDIEVFSK